MLEGINPGDDRERRKEPTTMAYLRFLRPLEKALRVILLQLVGVAMYVHNVWPNVRPTMSSAVTHAACVLLAIGFLRGFVWVRIYWNGAKGLGIMRAERGPQRLAELLAPVLDSLTWMLVLSCVLDFLFLPAYFLIDAFFRGFGVSGAQFETARLLFPQAFGLAALILAFLTRQFGELLRERSQLQEELELTV